MNKNFKTEITGILKKKVKEKTNKKRNIRLPEDIHIEPYKNNGISMIMTEKGVVGNVQTDHAAFEGWILILKDWVGDKYEKFVLRWNEPKCKNEEGKSQHYQRFLYRVYKFNEIFDWFEIDSKCQRFIEELKVKFDSEEKYVLNVPEKPRSKSEIRSKLSEHLLETLFVGRYKKMVSGVVNINPEKLDRQLPVGLFYSPKSKKNKIFPINQSQIDIWGIGNDGETLNIFELKKNENAKAGVVSELFLYTMMMEDAIKGNFIFTKVSRAIPDPKTEISNKLKCIHSYILAPELHPLVTKGVFELFNRQLEDRKISFGYISFDLDLSDIKISNVGKRW